VGLPMLAKPGPEAVMLELSTQIEYKAFATHMNPQLYASAHLGLSLLLRFNVLHKPFPDFFDPKDYATRPVYRSSLQYNKGISSNYWGEFTIKLILHTSTVLVPYRNINKDHTCHLLSV
jgi:hypothetical protein